VFQAIVDVVVHQGPLGLSDRLLNSVKLLRDVEARPPLLEHGDYRANVTLSSLESLHNVRVGLMQFRRHDPSSYPTEGDSVQACSCWARSRQERRSSSMAITERRWPSVRLSRFKICGWLWCCFTSNILSWGRGY